MEGGRKSEGGRERGSEQEGGRERQRSAHDAAYDAYKTGKIQFMKLLCAILRVWQVI